MWRRSTHCVGEYNCVEVDWRKSSYSSETANCVQWRTATASLEDGACVEYATSTYSAGCDCAGLPHVALVRDSKEVDAAGNNTSPVLSFDAWNWRRFIGWVSRG